jgi:hypothetical protein
VNEKLQGYIDGTLAANERREVEAAAASDPAVRAELQGLQAYRAAIRAAGRGEAVPEEALSRRLREAAAAGRDCSKRPWWAIAAPVALAALMIFGWLTLTADPMRLNQTRTAAILEGPTPEQASVWVRQRTGMPAPTVEVPAAHLVSSRYGRGWACYDFEVGGHTYFLYMSEDHEPLRHGEEQDGFFVGPRGIGWIEGQLALYLRGGDPESRREFAETLRGALKTPVNSEL